MEAKPETWPGPNGRTLTVVKAIVKRDPRNERWERRLNDGWIVRCGNAGRGCRGVIGYPASRQERILRTKVSFRPPDIHGNVWCLTNHNGYRGNARTGYYLLADRDRRPRRPLTHMTLPSFDDDERHDEHYYDVVGQYPVPPCIVFCPICGMPNYVAPPDADPPMPNWDAADEYFGYGSEDIEDDL